MATISSLSPLQALRGGRALPRQLLVPPSLVSSPPLLFGRGSVACPSQPVRDKIALRTVVRALVEGEILAPNAESVTPVVPVSSGQEIVSVPVSPSDMLTMFFKAEGTMDERAVAKVSKALEVVDGISNLKVLTLEGIASIELTQQTTAQATGVSSRLVEIIQGAGFKLQTLYLSFEDVEGYIN